MHKLAYELIDKHISKAILEITLEVCSKNFDEVFKAACQFPAKNDTTIGTCYRSLEALANEVVASRLEAKLEEVTDEMGMVRRTTTANPFAELAYDLWETFLEYYDVKGYVENVIADEWQEKLVKLQQDGILNDEGDYTGA